MKMSIQWFKPSKEYLRNCNNTISFSDQESEDDDIVPFTNEEHEQSMERMGHYQCMIISDKREYRERLCRERDWHIQRCRQYRCKYRSSVGKPMYTKDEHKESLERIKMLLQDKTKRAELNLELWEHDGRCDKCDDTSV